MFEFEIRRIESNSIRFVRSPNFRFGRVKDPHSLEHAPMLLRACADSEETCIKGGHVRFDVSSNELIQMCVLRIT